MLYWLEVDIRSRAGLYRTMLFLFPVFVRLLSAHDRLL